MTKRPVTNIAASVRERLTNHARMTQRPFAEVLQYFAIERFLFRLSASGYRDRFVLKGALMLLVWRAPLARPTLDIDLLGRIDNDLDLLARVVRELCVLPVEADGLAFDPESVTTENITVESEYVGVRARFRATLGTARIPMQLDVGFGDVVIAPGSSTEYPTLLGHLPPRLACYSRETAIAEKLHAMVVHGELNSRLKDFFDIWLLQRHYGFEGTTLAAAIRSTFTTRSTPIPSEPIGLTPAFATKTDKQAQWSAFLRKLQITGAPASLSAAVEEISAFLGPAVRVLSAGSAFAGRWDPGGPWRT